MMVHWSNGKIAVSKTDDCGFEPHMDYFNDFFKSRYIYKQVKH